MKQILFSFLAVCLWCVVHGETVLRHWDFEGDENGWTIVDQGRFSRFSQEAAFKGKSGLRIVDDTQDDGSNVISEPVPIKGLKSYHLQLRVKTGSDASEVRVYWQFFDKDDKHLSMPELVKECHATKEWGVFDTYAQAPRGASSLRFWIHSAAARVGDADFDELTLSELTDVEAKPALMLGKILNGSWLDGKALEAHIDRIAAMPHPRLFADAADFEALKAETAGSGIRRKMRDKLCQLSDSILEVPPVTRSFDISHVRILEMSRRAMYRISTLALSYKLTGKVEYRERCLKEMRAAATFEDWNPKHFLDTAEMTLALATGYDWLYDEISVEERKLFGEAILHKGILSAGAGAWWRRATNNWGQVCHAGMLAGVVAVAELDRDACLEMAYQNINNVALPMRVYAPNGNYPEGPNYWEFGTGFTVIELAILEKAFGTDFGLSKLPGFQLSGGYGDYTTGPSGLTCNFADSPNMGRSTLGSVWWFARYFQQPELVETFDRAWLEDYCASPAPEKPDRNIRWFHAYSFFWLFDRPDGVKPQDRRSLVWEGRGPIPIVTMRNTWDVDGMAYVGMKGGRPNASHSHMDGGSFVFDIARERWACDLGMEWYARVEKTMAEMAKEGRKASRWDLFRHNNFSHNTLAIDRHWQRPNGEAKFTEVDEKSLRVKMDLSSLYEDCKSASRVFELSRDGVLTVTDELTGLKPGANVVWGITTLRAIEKQEPSVVTLGNGRRHLAVTSHTGGTWSVFSVEKPGFPADSDNPKAKRVELTSVAPENGSLTIRVSLGLVE